MLEAYKLQFNWWYLYTYTAHTHWHSYTLSLCPNRKATAPSSAKDYNVRIIYKQSCNSTVNLTDSTIFHFHSSIKPSYGTASCHPVELDPSPLPVAWVMKVSAHSKTVLITWSALPSSALLQLMLPLFSRNTGQTVGMGTLCPSNKVLGFAWQRPQSKTNIN